MGWTEYAPVLVGADPVIPGAVDGTIVGSDPLETADADTSYVETTLSGATIELVSFRLPGAATASPGAAVRIVADARYTAGAGGLVVYAHPTSAPIPGDGLAITPGGDIDLTATYAQHVADVDFTALPAWADPENIIRSDTVFYLGNSAPLGGLATVRTTRLRILVESGRPLRQWPLDEGNGGTPRRYGGRSTSRSTSKNARGYQ
jgi:hypothetical protein